MACTFYASHAASTLNSPGPFIASGVLLLASILLTYAGIYGSTEIDFGPMLGMVLIGIATVVPPILLGITADGLGRLVIAIFRSRREVDSDIRWKW